MDEALAKTRGIHPQSSSSDFPKLSTQDAGQLDSYNSQALNPDPVDTAKRACRPPSQERE
jgi:hypothetical protein